MFQRWDDNHPPTLEQVKIQLTEDIRADLGNMRGRLAKIKPGEYEFYTVPEPNELIVFMPPSLDRLMSYPEAKKSDWTVSVSLPPESIFGPKDRIHFFRHSLFDGSAQVEIKVFPELDLYNPIRNFVHFGTLNPAEIPDLGDLLKVTHHLKAAMAVQN